METIKENKIEEVNDKILLTAYNQYRKNIERVIKYNKANPEKCRERQARSYNKIKETDPDRYQKMLDRKKVYYANKKASKIV